MATSAIPAFKAALFARLQAISDLNGVEISYGVPGFRNPDREWVWVGNADETQETAAMGQRRREETWEQQIVVSCLRPVREDQQAITERAYAIFGEIEDSLRAWSAAPPFFGDVVRVALVVGHKLEELVTVDPKGVPQDREARITIRVACAQRI